MTREVRITLCARTYWIGRGARELNEFAVNDILQESVDVAIAGIIPDPLRVYFESIKVMRSGVVFVGMAIRRGSATAFMMGLITGIGLWTVSSSTRGMTADQADPEILGRCTGQTTGCIRRSRSVLQKGRRKESVWVGLLAGMGRRVTADRAAKPKKMNTVMRHDTVLPSITPFGKAVAVESVVARDGQETGGGVIHAIKADGTEVACDRREAMQVGVRQKVELASVVVHG